MPDRSLRSAWMTRCCIAALLSLVWLAASGCANNAPASPLYQSASPNVQPDSPELTFGIIYPVAHPFYEKVTELAEQAAAAAGSRLIARAPDEANVEQQIRMLENMIRLRLDGIAISPIDSDALTPYINQAVEAGIPVVCFESDAPASKRLAYIGGDNKRAGLLMGKMLNELLHNGGMVLVENGLPEMNSHKERMDGFLDYIREETDIQILEMNMHDGSETDALTKLEHMIDDHPHFDAFVALDFISGASSVIAWKAMGLSRYALTFGMMPAIEEAIGNGQITLAVTQHEESWAGLIIEALHGAVTGKAVANRFDTGESTIDYERLFP